MVKRVLDLLVGVGVVLCGAVAASGGGMPTASAQGAAPGAAPAVSSSIAAPTIQPQAARLQFNSREVAPGAPDVLWDITLNGNFTEVQTKESGLVMRVVSGRYAPVAAKTVPIGGKDRTSLVVGDKPAALEVSKVDAQGVVTELALVPPVTAGPAVRIPVQLLWAEQRLESRAVVAEIREVRTLAAGGALAAPGSVPSQEYRVLLTLNGAGSKTDVQFFSRVESLFSVSGKAERRMEVLPLRNVSLKAGGAVAVPEITATLSGAKPEDRSGLLRIVFLGYDSNGNFVSVPLDVSLRVSGGADGVGNP